ncbi:MAG: adenine phosphoribosyltransferase [Flavobacteriales bacterium]|nr:adenine phosphoribosyltransferase [Flavobacteriales bacterium]
MTLEQRIKQSITEVANFPKPGISYKDITTLFSNPKLCNEVLMELHSQYRSMNIEAVIGLESRGFLLGMPLALQLNIPFILIRKKGKLPRDTFSVNYQLEYGNATIEMHKDALQKNQRVLIHDDLLATGGTASAAAQLVQMVGADVVAFSFLVELSFLNGRRALEKFRSPVSTFAAY